MGKPLKVLFTRSQFRSACVIVVAGRPTRDERFRKAAAAEALRRRRKRKAATHAK